MTVGELKESLDEYGDSVEVVIETEERSMAVDRHIDDVAYRSNTGYIALALGPRVE